MPAHRCNRYTARWTHIQCAYASVESPRMRTTVEIYAARMRCGSTKIFSSALAAKTAPLLSVDTFYCVVSKE